MRSTDILKRAVELLREDAQAGRESCQIGDRDWACPDCDISICVEKRACEERLKIAAGVEALAEIL